MKVHPQARRSCFMGIPFADNLAGANGFTVIRAAFYGCIVLICNRSVCFKRLAELVGKPDLPKDPYVTTAGKREEEQPGIDQTHRGAVLDIQEVGDAVAFLQNYRIMAAPVLSVTEIFGEAPR